MEFPPISLLENSMWLGSQRDASNLPWLRATGIRHVVNVGHYPGRPSWHTPGKANPEGIDSYTEILAYDAAGYPILQHLREVLEVILKIFDEPGSGQVLINCHQGINRSAALAAAFLAIITNAPVHEIISIMRQGRPVLSNPSFVVQLYQWDATRPRSAIK